MNKEPPRIAVVIIGGRSDNCLRYLLPSLCSVTRDRNDVEVVFVDVEGVNDKQLRRQCEENRINLPAPARAFFLQRYYCLEDDVYGKSGPLADCQRCIVYVSTRPDSYMEVLQSIEQDFLKWYKIQGRRCVVALEKPIAMSRTACQRLEKWGRDNCIPLWPIDHYLYKLTLDRITALIREPILWPLIGEFNELELRRTEKEPITQARVAEYIGAFWDMAPHLFAVLYYVWCRLLHKDLRDLIGGENQQGVRRGTYLAGEELETWVELLWRANGENGLPGVTMEVGKKRGDVKVARFVREFGGRRSELIVDLTGKHEGGIRLVLAPGTEFQLKMGQSRLPQERLFELLIAGCKSDAAQPPGMDWSFADASEIIAVMEDTFSRIGESSLERYE